MASFAQIAVVSTALLWSLGARGGSGFDHSAFDTILRAHVKAGRVDYSGIKQNSLAALRAYTKAIAEAKLAGLSNKQRLAFYINAYNASVVAAVIDHLPLSSVMKVKGFFDRKQHAIAGKKFTLNQLENKVIRPRFNEARIHFALVCAAKSCPPLQGRAFSAKRLNRDLDRLTRRFIRGKGVKLSQVGARVSKLFEWYAEDFNKAEGSVAAFLAKYRKEDASKLTAPNLKISYLEYDWSLNGS